MTRNWIRSLLLTALVTAYATPVSADAIAWTFTGSMTNGDSFGGLFIFDSETPDNTPTATTRGDYSNAGIFWLFNVGGTWILPTTTQGWSGNFEIFDDVQTNEFPFILGDSFRIYADARPAQYRSQTVTGIDIILADASGRLISNDLIPSVPPDLSLVSFGPQGNGWADYFGLLYAAEFQLEDSRGGIIERGRITSVSAVPEPSTLLLLCAGGALLFRRRRTVSTIS